MRILLLCLILIASLFSNAQTTESAQRKKQFNLSNGTLAVEGYDVLSYYTASPKKGSKSFSTTYTGITYYFSSQANLDLLKKSPEKFEPACILKGKKWHHYMASLLIDDKIFTTNFI